MPSIGPGTKPSSVSRCCTSLTSSPVSPFDRVRSSGTLMTGAAVATEPMTPGMDSGTVRTLTEESTTNAASAGIRSVVPSSPPPPRAIPASTTIPSRPAAATAGSHLAAWFGWRSRAGRGWRREVSFMSCGCSVRARTVFRTSTQNVAMPIRQRPSRGPPSDTVSFLRQSLVMIGVMPSRAPRNSRISRRIVRIIPGELSVDSPRVRGK